jgi:hypothetical protein
MPSTHSRTRRRLLSLAGGLFAAGTVNWAPTSPSAGWVGALEAAAPPTQQANTTDFVSFLRLVPDGPTTRKSVYVNDVERQMRLLGVNVPGPDADFDTGVKEYLDAIARSGMYQPPFISGLFQNAKELWAMRDSRGFDVRDVNQTVEAGWGANTVQIVHGRIDPAAIERAFAGCQECPTADRPTYQGVSYYDWTRYLEPNLSRRLQPPVFDQSGVGGLLLVQPELVHRTTDTSLMEAVIDSQRGAIPSLADVPDHGLLAAGLSELGAHSILISTAIDELSARESGSRRLSEQDLRAAADAPPVLRPFQAFGLGGALDDSGGTWITIALAHASEAYAAENVEILKRRIDQTDSVDIKKPWRELLSQVEARAEGRILVARMRHDMQPVFWYRWYLREDSLLVME